MSQVDASWPRVDPFCFQRLRLKYYEPVSNVAVAGFNLWPSTQVAKDDPGLLYDAFWTFRWDPENYSIPIAYFPFLFPNLGPNY